MHRTLMLRLLVAVMLTGVAAPLATLPAQHASVASDRRTDLAAAPPESVGVSSERLKRLDATLKRFVDEGRLAGVVSLLARHGKIVHFSAAGKKDLRQSDPMQKDSIFRIYSMTKPVTGVAMMMLYEEGKWRLDDPVSRYIPEFSKLKVHAGENADSTPKLEDARRSMTMRELMTHTGGLGYGLSAANPVDRLYRETRVLDASRPLQDMIDGLAKLPLLAQPGTRRSYSIAVDVQSYLVAKPSGQPFDEFLRTKIFQPLGMKDTGFSVPKEKLARLALVHGEDQTGKLTPPDDSRGDPTVQPLGPSGGGGLFSTAEDYLRLCQMLLNGGQLNGTRLLAPRTVAMMRTNHVTPEPLKTMRAGTGWGMDFSVVMDAAATGEPYSDGSFHWYGMAGTWF
jgi:CubicO group peptidase (beta-lactamase class C family)